MSRIRTQKLKLRKLSQESDLARVECVIRTEPVVARVRSAVSTFRLAESLSGYASHLISRAPKRSVIVGAVAAFIIPLLISRSDQRKTH